MILTLEENKAIFRKVIDRSLETWKPNMTTINIHSYGHCQSKAKRLPELMGFMIMFLDSHLLLRLWTQ